MGPDSIRPGSLGGKTAVKPPRAKVWCPYFVLPEPGSVYRVGGSCTGLPGRVPMIPSVEECGRWCGTANHTACPIYRSRHGGEGVEAWLRDQEVSWTLGAPAGAAV